MDYIKLGRKIKDGRQKQCLTQEDLGELVDITSSYVGQIERGERKVTLNKLIKIANVLKVSTDFLLEEELLNYNKDALILTIKCKSKKQKNIIDDIANVINKYDE